MEGRIIISLIELEGQDARNVDGHAQIVNFLNEMQLFHNTYFFIVILNHENNMERAIISSLSGTEFENCVHNWFTGLVFFPNLSRNYEEQRKGDIYS